MFKFMYKKGFQKYYFVKKSGRICLHVNPNTCHVNFKQAKSSVVDMYLLFYIRVRGGRAAYFGPWVRWGRGVGWGRKSVCLCVSVPGGSRASRPTQYYFSSSTTSPRPTQRPTL